MSDNLAVSDGLSSRELDARDRERVAWGAMIFDRIRPQWFTEVDLGKLSMWRGSVCIVGQTFGHFADAMPDLARRMEPDRADEFMSDIGDYKRSQVTFDVMVKYGLYTREWGRYTVLQDFWVEEIETRLRAHARKIEPALV